jgi:phosphoribosylglycinamide formyltransferase 1
VQPDPIAILVGPKGRGSNMAALAKACAEGNIPARVAVVIAPLENIPSVEAARSMGLMVEVIPPEPLDTYGARLLDAIGADGAKWICLAGYTRLLPKEVLISYDHHVLNIHPALLPKYGGKGMYGMRVHETVLGTPDLESGCTVHFVNEQYDDGAIILQRRVPRLPDDTPESLAHRVLEQEHTAYSEALARFINASRS